MQRIFIMILLTAFLLFMLPAVAWAQGGNPAGANRRPLHLVHPGPAKL